MKEKLCGILAVCLAAVTVLAGCGKQGQGSEPVPGGQTQGGESTPGQQESSQPAVSEELLSGKHHIKINMKDYGVIEVELDADQAPITVTNFVNLAKAGFYDGLTFHRIIEGFMMQGGDPNGNGTGGSDQEIKGEFSENGVDNSLSHTRGAISMARTNIPDSASSQFFIMHQDGTALDGKYACFGYVTSGMEIVDEICENAVETDGMVPAEYQPVIESIEVVD
ncbi:peptidyl-prolyl cis-trans isomerase A [Lachnospiraceae bacterium]|nr:peptidyl-prolyl cis-trans isomerase A [Lachnospiraceae bacterium]